MIIVRCSTCGGKVTDAEGYPTVAEAMRDLADHKVDVRGDSCDPEIYCAHCSATTAAPSASGNGTREQVANGRTRYGHDS